MMFTLQPIIILIVRHENIISNSKTSDHDAGMQVKFEKPLMHIPMLAIHLHPELREKGFNPNKQTHLGPILAVAAKNSLDKHKKEEAGDPKTDSKVSCLSHDNGQSSCALPHHNMLALQKNT